MAKVVSQKARPEAAKEEKPGGADLANAALAKARPGDQDSVDRIRDILFGAQARQYDQRFQEVEEIIKSEVVNAREDARKKNETLEQYAKKGLESLIGQVKAEQKERSDSVNDLAGKLDALNRALEKKIGRLEETTNAGRHDLQEQILQQSKKMMQEVQRSHAELTAALRKALEELRREKADRLALGNLFNEIGLRLKDEFKLPEAKEGPTGRGGRPD